MFWDKGTKSQQSHPESQYLQEPNIGFLLQLSKQTMSLHQGKSSFSTFIEHDDSIVGGPPSEGWK
jgi:hypothetical protein